jgi:para-nitrobenzyl esterase
MALLEVTVENGKLRGLPGGNQAVSVFKGIPYAKPPVGALRWREPQPADHWEGVKEAYAFADIPMQWRIKDPFLKKEQYPIDFHRSEDCLCLNVWTPAKSSDEKLPVAMWIFGGGFVKSYGHRLDYDGEGFAKRGVILVTINYRVGVFGTFSHPELSGEAQRLTGVRTSGNYCYLDQLAALKWVRRNIAAFGGDPDRITIFGQSAGAMSVQMLLSSKLTEGAVSGAIMQSGGGVGFYQKSMNVKLSEAEQYGVEFLKRCKIFSLEQARSLSGEEILDCFDRMTADKRVSPFPTPVIDGYFLEDDCITLLKKGNVWGIPTMLGCTSEDDRTKVSPNATVESIRKEANAIYGKHAEAYLRRAHGDSVEDYRAAVKDKNDFLTTCFTWSKLQNEMGRIPSYQYYFNQKIPASDRGAFHCGEIPYVFQTLPRLWRPYTGNDYELSDRICDYWTNFIKCGNPNGDGLPEWTPFTKESPMVMGLNMPGGMMMPPESEVTKFDEEFLMGHLD